METKVTVKTIQENKVPQIVGIVGALMVIAGAFLPWAISSVITVKGTDGDGTITLALAILSILFLLIKKIPAWIASILGAIVVTVGFIDYSQVKEAVLLDSGSVGIGLYLTILGSLVLILGSTLQFIKNRK